jgi:hypothetical protein
METRFGIGEAVDFQGKSVIIDEIRIDDSGIYYSAIDEDGQRGIYKQSDLKSL